MKATRRISATRLLIRSSLVFFHLRENGHKYLELWHKKHLHLNNITWSPVSLFFFIETGVHEHSLCITDMFNKLNNTTAVFSRTERFAIAARCRWHFQLQSRLDLYRGHITDNKRKALNSWLNAANVLYNWPYTIADRRSCYIIAEDTDNKYVSW